VLAGQATAEATAKLLLSTLVLTVPPA
jgi:hypothetical protein